MADLLEQVQELRREIAGIKIESIESIIASCVPVIVVDADTSIIVKAMPLADTLFGYMEGELQGKSLYDLIPERFHEKHRGHLNNYAKNPAPRSMGQREMELYGRKRDGTEFKLEISLHPRAIAGKRYFIATILKSR